MRHLLWIALVGATIGLASSDQAGAQVVGAGGGVGGPNVLGISPVYAAPGNYGTTYGLPGFGTIRNYSSFSSPYGVGYGYGYAPYSYLPGPYGLGLWRPGYGTADGYVYGGSYYNTFAAPYQPGAGFGPVPFGMYAPAFGPPFVPPVRYGR